MSSPKARRERLKAAAYTAFGDPALWTVAGGGSPLPVTVKFASPDELVRLGDTQFVVGSVILQVRASEIAEPLAGDTVQLVETSENYRIIGEPMRTRFALDWLCQAQLV